jgi:hypothetical protein
MTRQYLRKVSLVIGQDKDAIELSDFRIKFDVRRGDRETPNAADIRIYNLKDDTANRIQKEFTRVVLQAGYEGNYGIIFMGELFQVRRGRESATDTYVDIMASDGDSAYKYAIVNTSLAAGASAKDQINALLKPMGEKGVTQGFLPEGLDNQKQSRGVAMFGLAREYARDIARTAQCAWSIQDGKLNFVPLSAYIPGEVPVITSATGVVGVPEQTANGIKVRMLLNPSIKIGTLIQIDNASVQRMRLGIREDQDAQNNMDLLSGKLANDGFYYVT